MGDNWLAEGLDIEKEEPTVDVGTGVGKAGWLAEGLDIEEAPTTEAPLEPATPSPREKALTIGLTPTRGDMVSFLAPRELERTEDIPTPDSTETFEGLKKLGIWSGKQLLGATELAMNLASGMFLYLPSKLYGVMALPWGAEAARMAEESIASLGYQPYTKAGREAGELVAKGFEIFLSPARKLGEEVSKLSPEAGYLVEFGAELAEFAMTGALGKRVRSQLRENARARVERPNVMSEIDRLKAEKAAKELEEVEVAKDEVRSKKEVVIEEETKADVKVEPEVEVEPSEYISKKTGKPFKTKAATSMRRKQLAEEGIETTPVKVDEGWVLRKKVPEVKPVEEKVYVSKAGVPYKTRSATNIRRNQLAKEGIETIPVKTPEGWVLKTPEEIIVEKTPEKVVKFVELDTSLVDENIPVSEPKIKPEVKPKILEEAKEPWEMTEDEFYTNVTQAVKVRKTGKIYTDASHEAAMEKVPKDVGEKPGDIEFGWMAHGKYAPEPKGAKTVTTDVRKLYIEQALAEGKPVPKRVLADYPELKAKPRVEIGTTNPLKSPFFEDAKTTLEHKKLYNNPERTNAVMSDPDLLVMKLVNDVNRWYHGEKVDINKTTKTLSEIASRSSELVEFFEGRTSFETFKSFVASAASWAKKMKETREPKEVPTVKLTAGVDPADAYKAVKDMYDRIEKVKKIPLKKKLVKMGREAKKKFVDVSGNIKVDLERAYGDFGVAIAEQKILEKGSNARAAGMYKQARKEVYGRLSDKEIELLDKIIFSRRVIQIDEIHGPGKKKHPGGLGGDYHAQFLKQLREDNPSLFDKLQTRANIYFDIMRDQLKQLYDEGLITSEDYEILRNFDYSRRQLIDIVDPIVSKFTKTGKRALSVRDSGVVELAAGRKSDLLETDSNLLMLEVIARTQGRIMKNRANKMLLELARKDPNNMFVRKRSKEVKIPRGWKKISVFEEGKQRNLFLNKEFAEEWVAADIEMSYELANFIRLISGSFLLRPFATGINPAFAFTNIPRDIAHIWLTSQIYTEGKWKSTYSPVTPKFVGEMYADLLSVFSDALLRRGRWDKYIEEGGGMEFLSSSQGRLWKRRLGRETKIDKIMDVLGYVNTTSEIITRLALRERAMKKQARAEGTSLEEARSNRRIRTRASAVARDYLDFNQGGSYTKALDNGFPYTNAAVQGSRGIFRSAIRDPKTFGIKVAQLGMFATGLYLANRYINREAYESISDEVRKSNFVITTPWKFEDELGQTRYIYFTIPKDPGQKFFTYFFEYATKRMLGEEEDIDSVVSTMMELNPVTDTSILPPSAQSLVGYLTNKDFYFRSDIWKGPEVEPEKEYIPGKTHPFFIDVGKVTGLSPERLEYALGRLFASGNYYAHLVGWGYKQLFDGLPDSNKEQHLAMILSKNPILRRFIKVTNPYNRHAELVEDASRDSSTKRWTNTMELDRLTEGYLFHDNVKVEEIRSFVKEVAKKDGADEASRLFDRFRFQKKVRNLDNRVLWLRLHRLTPEARARVFHEVWSKASESRKVEMRKEMAIIGKKVFSEQFFREYRRLLTK